MRWLSRLTSAAVILIVIAGVMLLIRAKLPSNAVAGSFQTHAKFRDGSRLAVGSPVVIAGVRVGVISKLTVEGRLARVDMVLRDGLDLPIDSFATRRADSLFGDSYIEIIPSGGDVGAPIAQRMVSGDPIVHVIEGGSTDTILRGIANALPQVDNALDTVHDAVITGRKWVSGPLEDRLTSASQWLSEGHVERPIESVGQSMITIEDLTARGADAVSHAAPDVLAALDRYDRAIGSTRAQIRSVKASLVDGLQGVREGIDRVDPQLAQAAEVMTAINEGRGNDWRGTLGRLVSDNQLGDTLEDVTDSGREAVASFNRFKSWLGMRVELNRYSKDVRFYATAELRARNDKFYLVELERGPLGGLPKDELSEVTGEAAYVRQQEIHDRVRFTAQFGKQLGMWSVRGGLKDSTFGVGVDSLLFNDRLKLSADVFGAFQSVPRLKLTAALEVFRSLYVLGGVDDALNRPGYLSIVSGEPVVPTQFDKVRYGRDYFLGATLVINDADIAVLLRVYGALLVGLL